MSKSNIIMKSRNSSPVCFAEANEAPAEMTIGNRIVWKNSEKKGRGVFALVDIAYGEVIEQSPITIVPKTETDLIDEAMTNRNSVIDGYLLRWRPDISGQEYCLGHGYLMLYNHQSEPNGFISYDYDMRTISIIAARDIKTGEEITFDYDCEIWFQEQ